MPIAFVLLALVAWLVLDIEQLNVYLSPVDMVRLALLHAVAHVPIAPDTLAELD